MQPILRYFAFCCLLLFSFISIVKGQETGSNDSYIIQRGDMISIHVMDHPEFTVNNVIVLPDGFIQYPGIGSLKVVEMTPGELKEKIKNSLVSFIPFPDVTIFVHNLNKQDINVLGYVNKPGKYQIFEPIDILTAFSLAGGIVEFKRADQIKIIKANGNMFTLKIDRIWEAEHTNSSSLIMQRKSILIYPGDTIVVPEPKEFNWQALLIIVSTLNLIINAYRIGK